MLLHLSDLPRKIICHIERSEKSDEFKIGLNTDGSLLCGWEQQKFRSD